MIRSLNIQNIALISNMSLNFDDNLTILSGETGSGKSIIIDSLAFVLGERADKTMIKHGEERAFVEVVFNDVKHETQAVLSDLGFEVDDTVVISRTLTMSGKNECRVNGKICSTSMLKQITATLVDIFGQSQHLNLLKVDNHIAVIDGFCDFSDLMLQLRELYNQHRSVVKQLQNFGGSQSERERLIDILNFQINEISNANLSVEEEIELLNQHKRIVNIEKIATGLSAALNSLLEGQPGAVELLRTAKSSLLSVEKFDDEISQLHKRLESAAIEVDDIATSLEAILSQVGYDTKQIDALELRLETVKTVKRKYGGSIEEALKFLQKAEEQCENLKNAAELIENLLCEKKRIAEKMFALSHRVSAIRKATALKFSAEIEEQLSELGMKGTTFKVEFSEVPSFESFSNNVSFKGYDQVEFLFSANVGEPVKPLQKVISGGEMSRFMLAVKNITAAVENIPTMVFDEIDTGISGNVAKMVAIKLSQVSKGYQCIVITHLPQIVAMGDSNIYISKTEKNGRTESNVEYLNDINQKAEEVARLMGGVGAHSIVNAKEIIAWADECKKTIG